MKTTANDVIKLSVDDGGLNICVEDLTRRTVWVIDRTMQGYILRHDTEGAPRPEANPFHPFTAGRVIQKSDRDIEVAYPVPGGEVIFVWSLQQDHIEITANVRSDRIERITHPGAFRADTGSMELLVPVGQGVLMRSAGAMFAHRWRVGEATCLSMTACINDRGSLVVIEEDVQNKALFYGRRAGGPFCTFDLWRCEVDGWYERRVRLYVEDRGITAICKRHRRRLIERGMFVSWAQKIQQKPILKRAFGALFAFTGYQQGRQTDYVASARRLKQAGFNTVFYYPVRMNSATRGVLVSGDHPIWLSDDDLHQLRGLGGVLSAWSWVFEAREDPGAKQDGFRIDAQGKYMPHWKMDDVVFNRLCTYYQIELMRQQYQGPLRDMQWNHYDVNSLYGGEHCFSREHPTHAGRPLSGREDQAAVATLLGPDLNGNRLVSSEGFNEAFMHVLDIGSCKYGPLCASQDMLMVPMSMLVFHDSAIHQWWDLDTYNETPFGPVRQSQPGGICTGSGQPEKKAALDALYGCPPLLFPFGRQYGWQDFTAKRTFTFEVSVDDPAVQRAIRAALPVTHLHRRIGTCEMLSFDFLAADGLVQTTLFSDGTRVVANLADDARDTEFGRLGANSWIALAPTAAGSALAERSERP